MSFSSRLSDSLSTLDYWIDKFEAFILGFAILTMATNAIANVFGRYLFNQSLYFTDELNQFLIIIITFMGLGYITRKGKHIRMSAFYDLLAPRYKRYFMIVIALVTATTMLILAWYALEYVQKIARRGRVTPALQIPLYLTYFWVAIGFFLAAIQYLLTAIKNFGLEDNSVYISYSTLDSYDDPELADILKNSANASDQNELDNKQKEQNL
jgi:TRAP-type C4-dicarboxylate transport system permease small subunit